MAAERKKRQHTVPQFFLQGWAYKGQLDAIDKVTGQIQQMSVKNASVVRYFHSPDELEGQDDPDFMENQLAGFEGSVAQAIRALPGGAWPPARTQRAATADFVTMMLVRSPRIRRIIAEGDSPVEWSPGSPGDPVVDTLRSLGRSDEAIGDGATASYQHVTQMPHMFTAIRAHIAKASWLRIDFEDPLLLTGDSPVCLASNFRRPEWFGDLSASAFAIALSPECAIVLRLQDEGPSGGATDDRQVAGTREDAAIINGWTTEFAERWTFKHPYAEVTVGLVPDSATRSSTTIRTQGHDAIESVVRWAHRTRSAPKGALDEYYGSALTHGNQLKEAGDTDGAREAFAHATNADDPDLAAAAHLSLAILEHDLGNAEAAQHHYSVASSAAGDIRTLAYLQLGLLHQDQGEIRAARAAYQQAIDEGHPIFSPVAAFNLGHLELEHGPLEAATVALQKAAAADNPEVADLARSARTRLDSLDLPGPHDSRGD